MEFFMHTTETVPAGVGFPILTDCIWHGLLLLLP